VMCKGRGGRSSRGKRRRVFAGPARSIDEPSRFEEKQSVESAIEYGR
jgi:hypothetical protein